MINAALPPLPPVELVRPGIWSIPVPLPINSLRYVCVYVFETDRGPYLFDAGWNTEEAFTALSSGLEQIGTRIEDVQGVVATHIHIDHYGMCERVRDVSGAWVALHPADAATIPERFDYPEVLLAKTDDLLRRCGVPEAEHVVMLAPRTDRPATPRPATPDVLIEDGERPEIPGWDLRAIWTPGHSPGHCCYFEDRNRLMLTGDHVLSRITPSISLTPQSGENPLGEYFAGLDRLDEFDVDEALPAHQLRIPNLRARVEEIRDHHEERLGEIVAILGRGSSTAYEIASQMTWSRPWDAIRDYPRRGAVLEALAHLRLLTIRGVVLEQAGYPTIFSAAP